MSALRELCRDEKTSFNDDQKACVLIGEDCKFVVLTWYKRRGKTEGAWMIHFDHPPQPVTLSEAEEAILNNRQ